jgi:hypothetical protein
MTRVLIFALGFLCMGIGYVAGYGIAVDDVYQGCLHIQGEDCGHLEVMFNNSRLSKWWSKLESR